MAEKTETAKAQRVSVFIPRGASNDDPNMFVSVNGVNYLLPKGQESEVPAHIAAEIARANKAAQIRDNNKDKMLDSSR